MATINEIANIDSYTGNANLGGYMPNAIQIDNRPIQQLAAYTVMYNRSQYDQRQKDADEKIKKLGALAPYDLVNGIEKDKQELTDAQAKLTEYMAEHAAKGTPKSPKEKIAQELDFQKKIADQVKLIDSANARKIKLDKYKEATQADPKLTAQEKELRIKQAEQLFNNSDIYTLPSIPEVGMTLPKNGDPVIEKVNFLRETPNGMITETKEQFSIGGNWKTSYLDANNLTIPVLPENATQQQKDEYEQKKLAFSKSGIGVMQSAAEVYNHALTDPNYKVTATTSDINVVGAPAVTQLTETVDVEKIKQSNPIMAGVVKLAERYNAYAEQRLQDIKNGYYIDNVTGEKILLTGGDRAEDIKFIDVTKPLKPEDLVFLDKFARAAPDQAEKKYAQTDNAIQRAQIAETARNNKADQYLKGKEIKLAEDKWKASQTGGTTQINGAMERAKRIYGDLVKIAGTDGVISPDEVRRLNVEQLKYLGIENVETSEAGVPRTVFKALDLSGGEDKTKYAIQLVDGQVKVMKNAEQIKNGRYKGEWDNSKSTNLYNIGTNILNEELKNSGAKELNAYMGIDVTGGITSNTDGGSVSQSGGTVTKTTELSTDPKDWKQEGKNYRYKDGTLYDSKGNIIKQ